MEIIEDAQANICRDRVTRLLGRRKGGGLSARTAGRLERGIRRARKISRPMVVYTTRKIRELKKDSVLLEDNITLSSSRLSESLEGARKVTVFLATIGEQMDMQINSLMEGKNISDAYMLDAIGSVAVEGAVESFHQRVDSLAERHNEATTMRFSPGYCDWRIQEQRKIFDILDNTLVDVELSPGFLMTPRKSVSGVFGIGGRDVMDKERTNPCRLCGMRSCIARRA